MGIPNTPKNAPVAQPDEPVDLTESVAGEEDPGASIDIVGTPAQPGKATRPAPAADQDKPRGS